MWSFKRNSRPGAEQAARRLVILKHVVASALIVPPRDMLQELKAEWNADERGKFERDAAERRDELWSRLRHAGLWQHLSPKELEHTRSSAASMTERQQVDASWRLEAAQTLMWALRILPELPPFDTKADPGLLRAVPPGDLAEFVRSARLLDSETIDDARETAELWHWRSRTRYLIERGEALPDAPQMRSAGFRSYDDIVRFTARKAAETKMIPPCLEEDFPARGKAYRDLTQEEWSEVRSITVERHFALNWLCGRAPKNRWDETPTAT